MSPIFVGQIEALDNGSKTIYIEFLPLKSGGTEESFTIELKKTQKALADFLKKIKARVSKKNKDKIKSYSKYAQVLLDNKLGEIFVQRDNIQKLITKFNIQTRTVEGLISFSRKIRIFSPIQIGEKIYPAQSILKLTHEV